MDFCRGSGPRLCGIRGLSMSVKKMGALVSALAVALVLGYVLFLSPKDTEVEFKLADPSMSSADTQAASGSVSPAESGRVVVVSVRGESGWDDAARTTTDDTGGYRVEFPMTENGDHKVRVRVEQDGRKRAVTSPAKTVTVLSPTQLQTEVPKFARTDRPLPISGRVGPAAARSVIIESSTDGQHWTEAGAGSSSPDGKFTLAATGLVPGAAQVRVRVTESEANAAAVSTAQPISVEDYKAAGQEYLAIVAPYNKILNEYDKLPDFGTFTIFQASRAKMSKALTRQARRLRAYPYWPQEVKASIELLASSNILEADHDNRLARAKSQSEWNEIAFPDLPKGAANAPVVIRAALGLPKRR